MCVPLIALAIGASSVWAAKKKAAAETPLTEAGQKLLKRYARMLTELRGQLVKSVPLVEEKKQARTLLKADNEKQKSKFPSVAPRPVLLDDDETETDVDGLLVELSEKPEKKAPAIDEAETADDGLLTKLSENPQKSAPAIDKKVQAVFQFLKVLAAEAREETENPRSVAFAKEMARRMEAAGPLLAELEPFLSSDKLDAQLAKYVVLSEATPRGLAKFAQSGPKHEQLVERLLSDADLMLRMVLADGAKRGKYGQAMKIYTDIQKASTEAKDGVLQRLALATSMEHAAPVKQRNPVAKTDAPATVDPVKRYFHFERAYLDGELDAGFKKLTVWDFRMVVNGHEPDWTLAWGRKMLRNYRPDHISTPDYRWRYVAAVRTDIRYGSQDNKYDRPELQFFQNILMNGGVCGRRAFFGRFLLRGFGVPTTARPQRGHASLAHWTPEGWVICLGGGWGAGWVPGWAGGPYSSDLDFLAVTQARKTGEPFRQVKRAQWIGDVMGEKRVFGLIGRRPDFWYGVALYRQRAIIEEAKAIELAAVGEDIGEANESKVKEKITSAAITDKDRKIVVGKDGVITIPAVACSKPTNSTRKIKFMKSNLGGMQLHYNRLGKHEEFEYTFDAPAAGKYTLSARVVTPSWKQHLFVTANGAKEPIDIALPHTVGFWDKTKPVEISLVKGRNVLRFSRDHERLKGVTIKEFTLTPVNGRDDGSAESYRSASEAMDPAMVALLDDPVRKVLEDKLSQITGRAALAALCREFIRDNPEDYVLQKLCLKRLVSLQGAEASGDLLAALSSQNRWVRQFSSELAAKLPGEATTQKWLEYLGSAQDNVRPEILRVLAERRDVKAVPTIKTFLEHKDKHTRIAALGALVSLAGAERLSAVVKATSDPSPEIREAAYNILASSRFPSATEALLTLARKAKTIEENSIALQHCFSRIAKGKVPESDKLGVLEKSVGLSRRPEEKRLALPELRELATLGALRLTKSLLNDAPLREDAAGTAVVIAEALEIEDEKTKQEAVDIMQSVVKQTKNPTTRKAAEKFVYKHRPPKLEAADPAGMEEIDPADLEAADPDF